MLTSRRCPLRSGSCEVGEEGLKERGYSQREVGAETKELERFILLLYESQRHLHTLEHTTIAFGGAHVLVLNASTLVEPRFVFLGFSRTATKSKELREMREEYERILNEKGPDFAKKCVPTDFRHYAELEMKEAVSDTFGRQVERKWRELRLFDFV